MAHIDLRFALGEGAKASRRQAVKAFGHQLSRTC
jgi:hypothetical protein